MEKFTEVLALNTMLRPILINFWLVPNKGTLFTAKIVIKNLKFNGDSVMNKARITAQFMPAEETQFTKSTS